MQSRPWIWIVPGIIVASQLACSQRLTPLSSQPSTTESTPTSTATKKSTATDSSHVKPIGIAQTRTPQTSPSPQDSFDTFDACMNMFAYDLADTSVNLRDQPDGKVIASLPNLSRLQTEGPAYVEPGWNRVFDVGSKTWGYVWGELIYRTYYQVQDPQDTFANLRQVPNGEIITAVPNGTHVQFKGVDGDWTQVRLRDGRTGYISSSRLGLPSCF